MGGFVPGASPTGAHRARYPSRMGRLNDGFNPGASKAHGGPGNIISNVGTSF